MNAITLLDANPVHDVPVEDMARDAVCGHPHSSRASSRNPSSVPAIARTPVTLC